MPPAVFCPLEGQHDDVGRIDLTERRRHGQGAAVLLPSLHPDCMRRVGHAPAEGAGIAPATGMTSEGIADQVLTGVGVDEIGVEVVVAD